MLVLQIFLRLRRGDAVEPVPAAGRADAGHGHAVRLGRAYGVAHAHGQLSASTSRITVFLGFLSIYFRRYSPQPYLVV